MMDRRMRRRGVSMLLGLALGVGSAVSADQAQAQGRSPRGMRADQPPTRNRNRNADARRDSLEQRFQSRLEAIVNQRLELTDDQRSKLREVASRMEQARRQLRGDELRLRLAMRRELMTTDRPDEGRVAELLEEMPRLERRRAELLEQEQRDLARFLTAVQRARYLALQDELRRGMQELQRQRLGLDDSLARFRGRDEPRRRPPL